MTPLSLIVTCVRFCARASGANDVSVTAATIREPAALRGFRIWDPFTYRA
jgi:hypothetical protein